jgi:hypothetical protein
MQKKRKAPDSYLEDSQIVKKKPRAFIYFNTLFDLPLEINLFIIENICSSEQILILCHVSKHFCRISKKIVLTRAKKIYQSIPKWCTTRLRPIWYTAKPKEQCNFISALPLLRFASSKSYGQKTKSFYRYMVWLKNDKNRNGSANWCSKCDCIRTSGNSLHYKEIRLSMFLCIKDLSKYMASGKRFRGAVKQTMQEAYKTITDEYHLQDLLNYVICAAIMFSCDDIKVAVDFMYNL